MISEEDVKFNIAMAKWVYFPVAFCGLTGVSMCWNKEMYRLGIALLLMPYFIVLTYEIYKRFTR